MLTQSFAEKITEKIKSSHIFIFFTLKISQTEVDALIKFMNDLEF